MKGRALSVFFARRAVFAPLFADPKSGLIPTTGTVGEVFANPKSGKKRRADKCLPVAADRISHPYSHSIVAGGFEEMS